jgi:hypothetical protein
MWQAAPPSGVVMSTDFEVFAAPTAVVAFAFYRSSWSVSSSAFSGVVLSYTKGNPRQTDRFPCASATAVWLLDDKNGNFGSTPLRTGEANLVKLQFALRRPSWSREPFQVIPDLSVGCLGPWRPACDPNLRTGKEKRPAILWG